MPVSMGGVPGGHAWPGAGVVHATTSQASCGMTTLQQGRDEQSGCRALANLLRNQSGPFQVIHASPGITVLPAPIGGSGYGDEASPVTHVQLERVRRRRGRLSGGVRTSFDPSPPAQSHPGFRWLLILIVAAQTLVQ
jgi:hypothetical protein